MTEDDVDKYGGPVQVAAYCEAMELLGADVVRQRMACRLPIGDRPEDNPPPGLAKIWLKEQDAATTRVEGWRFWFLASVSVISAGAAIVAAAPVLKDWLASPKP
jgi:hypothetical protein